MFRRLTAFCLSLVLVLSIGNFAEAESPATWSTLKESSAWTWTGNNTQFVDLPNGNRVFLNQFRPNNNSIRLVAQVIDRQGVMSAEKEIATFTGEDFGANMFDNWDVEVTKSGTIVLAWAWTKVDAQTQNGSSNFYVSYSDDGLTWSNPVKPLPTSTSDQCIFFLFVACGYSAVNVELDGSDRIGVIIADQKTMESTQLLALSSQDGLVWTVPSVLEDGVDGLDWSMDNNRALYLTGLQSGFALIYSVRTNNNRSIKVARMPNGAIPFWQTPVTLETSSYLYSPSISSAGNGDLLATWWRYEDGQPMKLQSSKFSNSNKSWGASGTSYSAPITWMNQQVIATRGNQTALFWIESTNGQSDQIKYLQVENATLSAVKNLQPAAGVLGNSSYLVGANINLDSSLSLVFESFTSSTMTLFDVAKSGSLTSTPMESQTGQLFWPEMVSFREGGDVTYALATSNNDLLLKILELKRSAKPSALGAIKLKGMPKVAGKLSFTPPKFASISGAGAASYKWFACTKVVAKAPTSLPKTCKAIKGATSSSFKITKNEAKKFILASATSANKLGSTIVYSASTKVVK